LYGEFRISGGKGSRKLAALVENNAITFHISYEGIAKIRTSHPMKLILSLYLIHTIRGVAQNINE